MKVILPLIALTAGVSAEITTSAAASDGSECLADYIVTRCLETETPKVEACNDDDKECLCNAYQIIATCYNNCPNDPRAPSARRLVSIYCAGITTKVTPLPSVTDSTATSTTKGLIRNTVATPTPDGSPGTDAASPLVKNAAGALLACAGVIAVML